MQKAILITIDGPSLEALIFDAVDRAVKLNHSIGAVRPSTDISPYGDFNWLQSVYPAPESTLRQRSAKGDIPGTKKIGKRVLYEKAAVLNWLHGHQQTTASQIEQDVDESLIHQLDKIKRRGGRKAA